MNKNSQIIAYLAYPLLITNAIALYYLLLNQNINIQLATYLPVALAALTITILEFNYPHRKEWLPDGSEVKNDFIFISLIQVLLPKFLSFLLAITALDFLTTHQIVIDSFWPSDWSITTQAIMMILIADFFRYWLHRSFHQFIPFWRIHAIHHSPKKLYWMNVGRFHPIEKAMQYLFDALPFILLGVTEEVLALYFIFYSINGFFQHCNIELRLGWLNYIVSGPELHRWHHSKEISESNSNYGNNLIVWDIIFGTWFLPEDCHVKTLGLFNRNYPKSFLAQLKTPFIKGLDKKDLTKPK